MLGLRSELEQAVPAEDARSNASIPVAERVNLPLATLWHWPVRGLSVQAAIPSHCTPIIRLRRRGVCAAAMNQRLLRSRELLPPSTSTSRSRARCKRPSPESPIREYSMGALTDRPDQDPRGKPFEQTREGGLAAGMDCPFSAATSLRQQTRIRGAQALRSRPKRPPRHMALGVF